ncbi:MAG TPA: DUF819 family protein [Longimicrobiales bacterium]|nr:DUF819 family protein [Longimicrobiales bacterium]
MPALLNDPMHIFAYLIGVLAVVFWLSGFERFKRFFELMPPVIWAYFVPTLSTTFGIIPSSAGVYDWIELYLLPMSLFLLMISVDLPAIVRLGRVALVMLLAGTLGIVVGAPIAYLMFGSALPPEAWKGLAALSGSWIGGTANMLAIKESVGTPDSLMGPIIVVDTVVGYGWMGILLLLSARQAAFDKRIGADAAVLEETNRKLEELDQRRVPLTLSLSLIITGLGFVAAVAGVAVGRQLPGIGDPTIISTTTWTVLIVVTVGLLLSFTPVSTLEEAGASRVGYAALYLLLAAIGAQADLKAVLDAPMFLATGIVWIAIHAAILLAVARLMRAPLFFFATGSMANVGGAASAPVVAGVYHPALAPVGLLMAVGGYILGIYAALGAAWLLGAIAT